MEHKVVLLLGSNLGDRRRILKEALEKIGEAVGTVEMSSHIYETEPWGRSDQPLFLNQALLLRTDLAPEALLAAVAQIEKEAGRTKSEQWGPRHLDIDIIFYDDLHLKSENLFIPHPFFEQRNFALIPLLEIVPDWEHPVLHKTVEDLYLESEDPLEVILLEEYDQSLS